MELKGKTALVTGGGGGIGGGIAEALIEKGMKVVITDINPDWAAAESKRIGGDILGVQHDVTSLDSWSEVKQQAQEAFGAIDVLCNNAGIAQIFKPLDQVAPEEFSRLMAVNVTGVYNGIMTFAPDMRARGQGHVVNTASVNALMPFASLSAYSATKFAVAGLSESLRDELAPHGIGVSILYPGLTRSRMSERQRPEIDPQMAAAMSGRMMEPIWLGRAVARAIENNEPHIITHPAHRAQVDQRFQAILEAHKEPAQPGYEDTRFL